MKVIRSVALFALLAACQQANDENIAIDESNTANAAIETLPPDETMTNVENEVGNNSAEAQLPTTLLIPAAFHGRWGMGPADCEPGRSDAKGLITIGDKTIDFYESKGTLTKVTLNAPENFTGTFAFTGEGQSWTNSQNLKLTGSSNTLIRSETDVAQSYSYKRCR
jgi:hypothetical protein